LRREGVTVSFLSQGDGRLSLGFINVIEPNLSSAISRLPALTDQVVEVKIPGKSLSHDSWKRIGELTNLKKLSLENSNFSDAEMPFLGSLASLEYLNLVGTKVTAGGLSTLSPGTLKSIYLFNTGVSEIDAVRLRKQFSNADIILGNYQVRTLESDTTEQKEKYVVPEPPM
jgi:hypothetical protein